MKLLPSNWYPFTISQARIEKINNFEHLVIVFTVNSGEYVYRNLLRKYPLNGEGLDKLKADMQELKYIVYTNDIYSEYFLNQFVGMNGKMKVERTADENVVRNIIIEFQITTKQPEKDVTKEASEEHFYENNKGRKLPIQT